MVLSDKQYDMLKYWAQWVIPLLGSLYFGLCQIWGLPYGIEIVGSLTLIDTFLGGLLEGASKKYDDKSVETGNEGVTNADD